MKKNIFLLFIIVVLPFMSISQPNTLYFMKGIPQTKDINPARPGLEKGFYISMPVIGKLDLSASTNNWSYSDLIHKGTGTQADSLVFDLNKFLGATGRANFLQESVGLTFLEGGFKFRKNFFSASISEKEVGEVFFHRNLVRLINYGNYPFLGSSFSTGTFGLTAFHYREFAFNYSREMSKKLTLGGTLKILFGMSTIHTNGIKLTAASPLSGQSIDMIATGRADISAPVDFIYDSKGGITQVVDNFELGKYLNNYGNNGFAIDFGFSYKVNKKFELSGSIIDLGNIGWKRNTAKFTESGRFLYQGIQISNPASPTLPDLQLLTNQLSDSIGDAFRQRNGSGGFNTLLPVKLYAGGEYKLSDNASLSALARIRVFNNLIHTSLTGAANVLIWNGISLTGSYSIMESTFDNLGAGLGFRGGPFQVYAMADNIFSPFYPSTARNINVRMGINLIFRDREKEKEEKKSKGSNNNCHCPY